METSTAPVPDGKIIYWALILVGIVCILIEIGRVWSCYNSPCCEMHWLLLNKESICPVMTLSPGGFSWPV